MPVVVVAGLLIAVWIVARLLTENPAVRKWVSWMVIGVGMAALLMVAGAWLHFGGMESSSAARIAALQQRGLPTTGEELDAWYALPPGTPDATSAWVDALSALFDVRLSPQQMDQLPVIGMPPLTDVSPGEPWSQAQAVEDILTEHATSLDALRDVSLSGGAARFPISYAPRPLQAKMDHLPQLRNGARWLRLSSEFHAWRQEPQRVGEDLTAMIQLSQANRFDPCLISVLVNGAAFNLWFDALQRAVGVSPLRAEDCERMQGRLANIDFDEAMLRALQGERAMGLTEMRLIASPFTIESRRAYLDYLEYHERQFINPDDPELVNLEDSLQLGDNLVFGRQRLMTVRLLAPAFYHAMKGIDGMEARRRIGLLTLAGRRFVVSHGRLPEAPEELVDWLPESQRDTVFIDPFTQQPLTFVRGEDHVIFYSVGRDETDDGGQIEATVVGDRTEPPPDVGIRLSVLSD